MSEQTIKDAIEDARKKFNKAVNDHGKEQAIYDIAILLVLEPEAELQDRLSNEQVVEIVNAIEDDNFKTALMKSLRENFANKMLRKANETKIEADKERLLNELSNILIKLGLPEGKRLSLVFELLTQSRKQRS